MAFIPVLMVISGSGAQYGEWSPGIFYFTGNSFLALLQILHNFLAWEDVNQAS